MHQKPSMQLVATVDLCDNEWRKISAEDVEKLAASASVRRRPDSQDTASSGET